MKRLIVMSVAFSLQIASRGRDFGVDVSHYQGATGISQASWSQMYSGGRRFAFVKASEGLTGPDDAAMSNNVVRASAAGLLVGVYHYPHPENRTNTAGAILEADHFISYAGNAIGPGRLRPVLDVEGSAANLSKTGLTDWIIAFSDRIISRKGPGAAPIIYMNRSFARDEVDTRLANYDLWLAYYTNVDVSIAEPPPTTSYPDPTGVFNNWSFWQYTDSGSSGGISPLDLDVCHSEYKTLGSFLIPFPPIVVSSIIVKTGGVIELALTNTPGRSLTAVASTNIALPLINWSVLGPFTESPAGFYKFSDIPIPANRQRFYRVRSP
ncbi:MAG: glycoside hydrolase family 25 protein [Verrucomicrobiota bacterium]